MTPRTHLIYDRCENNENKYDMVLPHLCRSGFRWFEQCNNLFYRLKPFTDSRDLIIRKFIVKQIIYIFN